jgi:hypothetical protein
MDGLGAFGGEPAALVLAEYVPFRVCGEEPLFPDVYGSGITGLRKLFA